MIKMSLQEIVRNKMYEAMKNRNKQEKDAYVMLLDQLKKKEIDTRRCLTETEENEVLCRIVKQTKESIEMVPAGTNEDFVAARKFELEIYSKFLPEQLSEDEIKRIISETMSENNITAVTNQTKGLLMKHLMPKVKGKADGKLVAQIVTSMM